MSKKHNKHTESVRSIQNHCIDVLGLSPSQYEEIILGAKENGLRWTIRHEGGDDSEEIYISEGEKDAIVLHAHITLIE